MADAKSLMVNANLLRRKHGKSSWVIHLDGNPLNDQIENLIAVPDYVGPRVVKARESNGGSICASEVMAIWTAERERLENQYAVIDDLWSEIKAIRAEANRKVHELKERIYEITKRFNLQKPMESQTKASGKPRVSRKNRRRLRKPLENNGFAQKIVTRKAMSQKDADCDTLC